MTVLRDVAKKHIESLLDHKNGLYYYGTLSEYGEQQTVDEVEIKLLRKNPHQNYSPSGYLYIKPARECYDLSYAAEHEFFHFQIYSEAVRIKSQPYQVTQDIPVLSQAIVKEDWTTPQGVDLIITGSYENHRWLITQAFTTFKKEGTSDLWLPTFFRK